MKLVYKFSFVALVAALLIGLVFLAHYLFAGGPRSRLAGFDRDMQHQYEQLKPGESRDNVIAVFGSPLRSKATFCLPSGHRGYEDSQARAMSSNAVTYDLWINGINWYYCVGFDEAGLLAFKAEGND